MKRRKAPTYVKKQKNNSLELFDRISALPDPILGLIVSFLPTKNAVATSILSKRWKLVWTTVHNLDFCHELIPEDEEDDVKNMRFVQFVNRVLLHHDAGLLNRFRLVWNKCILSHASSWVSTAIRKNVHELLLCVETLIGPHYDSFEVFEMPICVFSCVSLQSLELNGGIYVPAAIAVCLPRLESLKLVSVRFESDEAFENFMSGCPKLNYLHIHTPNRMLEDFGPDDDFTYIISSTSLRRLELRIEYEIPEIMCDYYCNLELEASSLEYLKIVGFIPIIILRKTLGSLIEADLNIDLHEDDFAKADICNSIVEVVRVFDCAKVVTLSAHVMWALNCATISLLTKFTRLVKLETQTYCCACSSLQDFIQSSDNLEVLTIYQFPNFPAKTEHHDHSSWTSPLEVARCLSNCLKKVVLKGYYGEEDEREMIRYLLKNGSSLEAMQISCHKDKNGAKFDLVQEICQFPRKSPVCEVKFICWTSNSMA